MAMQDRGLRRDLCTYLRSSWQQDALETSEYPSSLGRREPKLKRAERKQRDTAYIAEDLTHQTNSPSRQSRNTVLTPENRLTQSALTDLKPVLPKNTCIRYAIILFISSRSLAVALHGAERSEREERDSKNLAHTHSVTQ